MTIRELKENEPLNIEEAFLTYNPLPLPDGSGRKETDYINLKQIRTVAFSDGEVKSKSEVKTHETNEYFFKNKKSTLPINKVNTQEVYYENYSYIVTYLIALEFKTFGKLKGWFDTVKDVSVYLKDINDKKALENVKKLIREINYQSIDIDGVFHETHAKKLTLR